ncbi:MAG: tetratricopeptide repeat protein [Candidatus Zixiibacteriota bacterium]
MAQVTELDDRIAKCNKILNENPNSQIFAALAEAYRKKGEIDKAFRICQTGLKIHPNYGSAHMVMAKINFDKGLFDWAEMEVHKAIELDGASHATDLTLAEIHVHRGEFAKALRILNKLQESDPNNRHVQKLLDLTRKLPLESPVSVFEEPPVVAQAAAVEEEEPAPFPTPRQEKRITYKELLDFIASVGGVDGVLLINREGLVADQRWDDEASTDLYGAVARDIEKTIQSQMEISRFGEYETILLEADDLIIKILPLKDNLLLIKANKQINLGTLRLKLPKLLSRLEHDLS